MREREEGGWGRMNEALAAWQGVFTFGVCMHHHTKALPACTHDIIMHRCTHLLPTGTGPPHLPTETQLASSLAHMVARSSCDWTPE